MGPNRGMHIGRRVRIGSARRCDLNVLYIRGGNNLKAGRNHRSYHRILPGIRDMRQDYDRLETVAGFPYLLTESVVRHYFARLA
jgi:hypothetical protein